MITRRAKTLFLLLLALVTACSPADLPAPTPTSFPATAVPTPTNTPTATPTFTPAPLACLSRPGRIEEGSLEAFKPAQEFRVYLPPCYDELPGERYPVLYLLHGQTYSDDQWVRLGAAGALDELIQAGRARPFLIVFPDDRYWNLQAGPGFGKRLVENILPYVDANYRTLPERDQRAIGGLSRGAGWSLRLGLTHWDLFGAIGLHSVAVKDKDASRIDGWIEAIPPGARPHIFMDIGQDDQELRMARQVESTFNDLGLAHEWHLYTGDHTEKYWSAHVDEYIRWYAEQWEAPQ